MDFTLVYGQPFITAINGNDMLWYGYVNDYMKCEHLVYLAVNIPCHMPWHFIGDIDMTKKPKQFSVEMPI